LKKQRKKMHLKRKRLKKKQLKMMEKTKNLRKNNNLSLKGA